MILVKRGLCPRESRWIASPTDPSQEGTKDCVFAVTILAFLVFFNPLGTRGAVGAPNTQFVISQLPGLRCGSSKACRTWLWPLWTSIFSFVTFCDNLVPVWHLPWHNMISWFWVPRAPLGRQTLDLSCLGCLGSVSDHLKQVDPGYASLSIYLQFCGLLWKSITGVTPPVTW